MHTISVMPRKAMYGLLSLIVLSSGAFLIEAVREPQRIWANLLVVSYGLLGLGLGGAVLLALFFVTGARWSDLIRPVAEKMTRLLPAGAVGVALVLIARPSLYPWITAANESGSHFQAFWLSRPFFLGRAFIYLALWIGLASLLVGASRRQSSKASGTSDGSSVRIAGIFLVVFALTCWLASVDWIMSLEPKWTSTIFGIYHFSGMFLSALATFIVLAIWFDQRGLLGGRLTKKHLYDLGTLLFSFSSFWMYAWFSQYLLIWYVNNPEETEYYVLRQQDIWQPLFFANLVLNWGIPFLVLLFRPAKENPGILLTMAGIILAGRLVDLYLMILPPIFGTGTAFGLWDFCLVPGMVALATLIFARRFPLETSPLRP